MKKSLLFVISSLFTFCALAQPTLSWDRFYNNPANLNDEIKDMVIDAQGNAYVTGFSFNGTNDDVVTIKYSPSGQILWSKTFNGSGNADDYAKVIRLDGNGNVIVGGKSYSSGNGFDFLILKYDNSGTLTWSDTINGPSNSEDELNDIYVDANNKIYCVGNVGSYAKIVAYPSNSGTPIWTNTQTNSPTWYTRFYKVAVTGSGDVKVLADYGTTSQNNVEVFTYNSSGVYQGFFYWFGATYRYPVDMVLDGNGVAYVCAYSGSTGDETIGILSTGQQSGYWASYIATGTANSRPSDIYRDASGNVYVTGYTDVDASAAVDLNVITLKFNSSAVQQWATPYGGTGEEKGISLTVLGGETYVNAYSTAGNATTDIVTLKYSSSGVMANYFPLTYVNSGNNTATYDEIPVAMGVLNTNSIYVAGYTTSSNQDHNRDFLTLKYCSYSGVANAGNNQNICQDASGQLSASGGVSYEWSGPQESWLSATNTANPNITVPLNATVGAYTFTCTFTDASGCTTTDDVEITVLLKPQPPVITAQSATTFCSGGNVTITSSSSTGNTWTPNIGTGQSVSASATGNYSATVTTNGCTSNSSNVVSVTVNQNPTVTVTPSGSVAFCDNGTLTANVSGGTPSYTYSWTNSSSTTQAISVSSSNTYAVTVTDGNQCSGTSASVNVTVNSTPSAPPDPTASNYNPPVCQPTTINLCTSGSGTFTWYMDGFAQSGSSSCFTASATGTHDYTVSQTLNNCPSQQSSAISITIFPQNIVTVTPSLTEFCEGGSITLTASAAASYIWSPGGATTNTFYTDSSITTVTITAIDGNGCSGTATLTVTEHLNPNPPTISWNWPNLECSPNSGYQYDWYYNSGVNSLGNNSSYEPTQGNGNYSVTITDNNGCQATSEQYPFMSVGMMDNPINDFFVYPNPASNILTIENLNKKGIYQLQDVTGKILISGSANLTMFNLDISSVNTGIYFLSFQTNEGRTTKKIEVVK